MNDPISEADLHAYADNRLAPSRLIQVEAWLAERPEQRAQVDAWRAQSAGLHRAYDRMLAEPVPARLMPAANRRTWPVVRYAAAAAWLSGGIAIGFFLRGAGESPAGMASNPLPKRAAVAHVVYVPEVRHPVEVGADQEAHLVAWLSKRLGAPLRPPRLESAGYRLMGGRLLPGETGEVAQFMYQGDAGRRLTLYLQPLAAGKPGAGEAGFRYARENGVDVFYWVEDRFGYALSGDIGREGMLALANEVYRQRGPR